MTDDFVIMAIFPSKFVDAGFTLYIDEDETAQAFRHTCNENHSVTTCLVDRTVGYPQFIYIVI